MSTRLENFIRDNREQFDGEEPKAHVWEQIEQKLQPAKSRLGGAIRMNMIRWSAAAAVLIIATLAGFYFFNASDKITLATTDTDVQTNEIIKDINPTIAKEVYHFTQLIELKQTELKQIAKAQPELYNQFIGDINKLDSSYNALKKELPQNPNQELLLEAMIQNLQLQTDLLNQQLTIIKQIKQSKTNSHEKNTRSI